MTIELQFSEKISERIKNSSSTFVVTGANGWLGRATLEMLHHSLGDTFHSQVVALGSNTGDLLLSSGFHVPVAKMSEYKFQDVGHRILFHYAFLTKDKFGTYSSDDYISRNKIIRNIVISWIEQGYIDGVILPSSGAVYDYLNPRRGDDSATIYGKLKFQDEQELTAACEKSNIGIIIPRIFNLSGPFINKFESYALASFIAQSLTGTEIKINSSGLVYRSYYFIGDLIDISLMMLLENYAGCESCFDVTGHEVIELGDLADRIIKVLSLTDSVIVNRNSLMTNTKDNCYVGDRTKIDHIESIYNKLPIDLDRQILMTSKYIDTVLQKQKIS